MLLSDAVRALLHGGVAVLILSGGASIPALIAFEAVFGAARAFFQPAASALGPMLVPLHLLPRAIATNSLTVQLASILGPALGGALCVVSPVLGYVVSGTLYASAGICALMIRGETRPVHDAARSRVAQIREGLVYLWGNKLVLGAISLDLFAVLLGGATALLPVYALDILHGSAFWLGLLRASPAIGALAVSIFLARWPLRRRAGPKMFAAVAVFGLATIVFGVSRSLPLSVVAMMILGGADVVSVVVRSTLVQLHTPEEMRGRVSAVNLLFIVTSNQFGEFESGAVAALVGTTGAVVLGGVGTLLVTLLWMRFFPVLRRLDRLEPPA
jgi:MFS family permease